MSRCSQASKPRAQRRRQRTALSAVASLSALAALAAAPRVGWALGGPAPGAVSAQTVKLPSGPGSIRGLAEDAKVDAFTGQVEYQVPVELPSGPGGFTPSLALGYAGELGNGPLGVGWSIAQVGIRRSLRLGVPGYDAADELEVSGLGSGGTLVQLADGSYRLEGQGQSLTGVAVAGGFELTAADGTVYRLGTTAEGRKASGAQVAAWYLQEVRNVFGQTIEYRYSQLGGEVYLSEIGWGPLVGGVRTYRAQLVYEARPDAVVSYRTGFRVETSRRVDKLVVWSAGQVRRVVELSYDNTFQLSRLSQVRVQSADGQVSLPPVTFQYAAAGTPATQQLGATGGWALNASGTSLFDVDDDGVMDLLRLTSTGHSYRRNLGGSFDVARPVPGADGASLTSVRLLDLTGDSGAEMVWQQGTQWKVFSLGGASAVDKSWTALGNWAGAQNLSLAQVAVADLDGDFRMDALTVSGSSVAVRMGTETGLAAPVTRPAIDLTRTYITPGSSATSFPDINGDGLADVAYLASSALYLYLGKGDGTFERYRDVPYPWTGTFDLTQIRLGDLDRDGLMDVAIVRAGNVAWYRGRAGGDVAPMPVVLPRPPGTDAGVVVAIADANGNGSEDLVWSQAAGMWILDFAGATSAGMLTAIDNGLGQRQSFGYGASSQLALAAATAGNPWTLRMPVSIPVTVQERRTLASGEPARSQRLDVRDGIYDRAERRFIGFAEAVVTRPDPADGAPPAATARNLTRFSGGSGLDRTLRGQVLLERVETGAGALLRETVYDVATVAVAGLPATDGRLRRPVVRSVETRHYEGQTTPLVTRTEHAYDAEGRQTEERRLGRLDQTGDETIVRRRYTTGVSARGVRDLVCEEWMLGLLGATEVVQSHAQVFYGDAAAIAPSCDAGAGVVRQKQQLLSSESRWVTTFEAQYDALGNRISSRQDGVTREVQYDALGLYPVAELVRPSQAKTLRWEMAWNSQLGQPSSVRDASGVLSLLTYDGVGRVTSVARAGQPAHLEFRYRDSGPRPYTETFTFDGPIDAVTPLPAAWAPGLRWRHSLEVLTSAAEPLLSATRLEDTRWLVSKRRGRDAFGRTTSLAEAYEATGTAAALVASAVPAAVAMQTVSYDALDRVTAQTLATGSRAAFSFRAFEITATTDGLAPVTRFYDGQHRIQRTERTIGGTLESVRAHYDAAGRITRMVVAPSVEHLFSYDSLGRLTSASDPDLGARAMTYDDAGRLLTHRNGAGQTVSYAYDGAGRLAQVDTDAGAHYVYHYDDALDGATFGYTAGRLAWIDEPTGRVELGYDPFGQLVRSRRAVGGKTADQVTVRGASGLVLSQSDGDGLDLPISYDAAGRLVGVGTLWQLEQQDAGGRPLRERFGNGVVQTTQRNAIGQAGELSIFRPSGTALYRTQVAYNAYGAISSVQDLDGVGLDFSASFAYDGAARLTEAILGAGAGAFTFRYQYDGLQNMVRREAHGPKALGILLGQYRHGELGGSGQPRSARQLTSIVPEAAAGSPAGAPTVTFDYDGAGRTVRQGGRTMTYNGLDQLVAVGGVGGGAIAHAYGYDGLRVRTVDATGGETVWFSPSLWERADGTREYDVRVGERLVARVSRNAAAAAAAERQEAIAGGVSLARGVWIVLVGGGLLLMGLALAAPRRWQLVAPGSRLRIVGLGATLVTFLSAGCNTQGMATQVAAVRVTSAVTYYHHAIGAGPTVLTREDGTVLEERRFEPYGAAIDAAREVGGATTVGDIDLAADPHNALGKLSDPSTGWSDHGARWTAPETGRWLTPDPPVRAPSAKHLASPWELHPYQFVNQNPVLYWDPDGRDSSAIAGLGSDLLERDGITYRLSESAKAALGPVFERAWDFDVSKVRVVFGPTGKADAFTFGNLVVLNRKSWESADQLERLKLLGHEITHSVQFERLAAPGAISIGGALNVAALSASVAQKIAKKVDEDNDGVLAAILTGLLVAVAAYNALDKFKLLKRYGPEFLRPDNYNPPQDLLDTPIEEVNPVDEKYTLDQISERMSEEVEKELTSQPQEEN